MKKTLALLLLFLAASPLAAINARALAEQAKQFEVKPVTRIPSWATDTKGRLFTVAWLSDLHVGQNNNMAQCEAALACIREEIKPAAVFITGDNYAVPPKGAPGATRGLQRHNALKEFLQNGLQDKFPVLVIPGDNFFQDFDKVFGADKFTAEMGGFKFIFGTVDIAGKIDGCAVFEHNTLQWIRREIVTSPRSPVIYIQHEPVLPGCFLDAVKLQKLFDESPQVVGVLGGHLHLDLELKQTHWTQWIAPSVGHSHRPGFKVLEFYSDRIIALSYEWDAAAGKYRQAFKFQRIAIPPQLRGALRPCKQLRPQDVRKQPVHPRVLDTELDKRQEELDNMIRQSMVIFGVKYFLNK